jgi:hypothetical protein
LLEACGSPAYCPCDEFARTHPATADLAFMSLTQGCPVKGGPAPHLRKSFGKPDIIPARDSVSSRWRFELDEHSSLEVLVEADTIVSWDVVGRPSQRIAQDNYFWSISQAEGFPARVIDYLKTHPATPPRTAFLLFRACPQPGLAATALRASWGQPSEIVRGADTTSWIYGYGVEGQHEIILLVGDTVRAFREGPDAFTDPE